MLDLAIADARLRAFMPRTLGPHIVEVDERSLAEIGRWPRDLDKLAALADELFANQRAAVIGFDMLFVEPDTGSGLLPATAFDAALLQGKPIAFTR